MAVTDRVATALACSAVDPRLAGLLFYDLDPALIYPLARWLAHLLSDAPEEKPLIIPVWQGMTEDMLWGRIEPAPAAHPEDPGFRWKPGPVTGYERRPGIVVMSDLALAGRAASRAAVVLLDAEVAHLERSGVARLWHPRDRWLATVRRLDVGRVSAHLLDRFAVRVDASDLRLPRDGGAIAGDPGPFRQAVLMARRAGALPVLSAAGVDRIVQWNPEGTQGSRRDLALARLARALAALGGESEVLPSHVDSAADLIDLAMPPTGHERRGGPARVRRPVTPGAVQVNGENGQVPVVQGDGPRPVARSRDDETPAESALAGPYPEDVVPPRPDLAALRIGWQRALTGPPRGTPIGTLPALDLRDIAMFATLLNAARYQRFRCRRLGCPMPRDQGHRLHVRTADLLSYRRAPQPGYLLVLLLDHTCRDSAWDWIEALAPYLRWGYVNRALIGVVELGIPADDPKNELRASQFRSRGVFDPAVLKALSRRPGRAATPLAHGLTLADGMLRHDTQQAGALISEAFLVVVTDGRANVPLVVSQTALPWGDPVGRVGLTDAEAAANKIKKLHRVRSAIIYPGSRSGRHFAVGLAAALGAPLVDGTLPPVPDFRPQVRPARSGGAAR